MEKILKFLEESKIEKYEELLSSIELQKDILEEISKEIGTVYVPKLISDKNYEKVNEAVHWIKEINDKTEFMEKLLEEKLEVDEEENEETEVTTIKDYDKYRVDENEKHSLYEKFIKKRPCAFMIENKKIEANSWKEVLVKTCNYLEEKNINILKDIVENEKIKGRKRSLLSSSKELMFTPEKLKIVNGYVETNLSADGIKNLIKKLLKLYGISLTKYNVYFRADYTDLKN